MYDDHAKALRYFSWFSAGLFSFGIILEGLKNPVPQPTGVIALLVLIGLLCHGNMYADWRADKVPGRRGGRRRR